MVLLIDFGSTFTKVAVVDLEREEVLGTAQAASTVDDDMTIGLQQALKSLSGERQSLEKWERCSKLACSSAAGGLRLVTIGLVPSLTTEASRRAALGAGAKVIGTYSYELSEEDLGNIEGNGCDTVLLSGGTDGGNKDVILHNANVLAQSRLDVPIVVAGNRTVSDIIRRILESAGKYVEVTENILPRLDVLNVDPCRSVIREIFIKRIVRAKGLDKAQAYVGPVLMPTPMAVLRAARLLADGTGDEAGIGELVVIDIGGATTDIHSIAKGYPTRPEVFMKGLPEPYEKRTVEGDLGLRYNASTIVDVAGERKVWEHIASSGIKGVKVEITDVKEDVARLYKGVGFVPKTNREFAIDIGLARTAAEIASERHVAMLREIVLGGERSYLQYGKDLTEVKTVIGVGGIFAHGRGARRILEAGLFDPKNPLSLRPKGGNLYIDENYILYGIGLLSDKEPTKSLRIGKKYLKKTGYDADDMQRAVHTNNFKLTEVQGSDKRGN